MRAVISIFLTTYLLALSSIQAVDTSVAAATRTVLDVANTANPSPTERIRGIQACAILWLQDDPRGWYGTAESWRQQGAKWAQELPADNQASIIAHWWGTAMAGRPATVVTAIDQADEALRQHPDVRSLRAVLTGDWRQLVSLREPSSLEELALYHGLCRTGVLSRWPENKPRPLCKLAEVKKTLMTIANQLPTKFLVCTPIGYSKFVNWKSFTIKRCRISHSLSRYKIEKHGPNTLLNGGQLGWQLLEHAQLHTTTDADSLLTNACIRSWWNMLACSMDHIYWRSHWHYTKRGTPRTSLPDTVSKATQSLTLQQALSLLCFDTTRTKTPDRHQSQLFAYILGHFRLPIRRS